MKLKSNQTRTYDGDGYKKRAACLCFRNESEEEVRRPAPEGFPLRRRGMGRGAERRQGDAIPGRAVRGRPPFARGDGSAAHVHGAQVGLCGGAEGGSLPRGGGCGRAGASRSILTLR